VVQTTAENVIRDVSALLERSAFQACSIDHSDISPFRINGLRAARKQIITQWLHPPSFLRWDLDSAVYGGRIKARSRKLCKTM
jgi:hypothetical protein